jgi:hypothetical protein
VQELAIGLVTLAVMIILAFAALTAPQPLAAPPVAPIAQPMPVEPWSPGGHITGSVHDGGAYGVAPLEHTTR